MPLTQYRSCYEHLSWEVHVNAICKIISAGIGVLKRTKPFVSLMKLYTPSIKLQLNRTLIIVPPCGITEEFH